MPRSYIYAHKNIPIWFDEGSSDRDTCTALWTTKERDMPEITLISSYWDGTIPALPDLLQDSIDKIGDTHLQSKPFR